MTRADAARAALRHLGRREELLDRGESARSVASWSPAPSDDWIDRLDL